MNAQTQPEMENPFKKAIGITVHQHKWGTRRKVRSDKVTVEADGHTLRKDAVTLTKRLLKCDEYDAIVSADRRIHEQLDRIALPSILRRGVYLIPLPLVPDVDEMISEYMGLRSSLVHDFMARYDRAVSSAEERLGPLFNPAQYPESEEIRKLFSVEKDYVNFGLPDALEEIDSSIADRERKKIQADMRDAAVEIRAAMRGGLQEMWGHLTEQLTGTTPTGRPKVIRESAVSKINDWMDLFASRNLTNDAQLQTVVEKCKSILEGVDVEELRKQGAARSLITQKVAEANAELTKLVQEIPRRKFAFDDED